jgi:hypothetical protein
MRVIHKRSGLVHVTASLSDLSKAAEEVEGTEGRYALEGLLAKER